MYDDDDDDNDKDHNYEMGCGDDCNNHADNDDYISKNSYY